MLQPLTQKLFLDNWEIRRRWMMAALIWMAGNVQYLVIWGRDNALHQNLAITFLGAIVSILCFYIFGAVWDDRDKRARIGEVPPEQPGPDDHPERSNV